MEYEYNDWFPSYGDLPMEIILHIFSFLDHADLQSAGMSCTRWRQALFDPSCSGKTRVRFSKVCLSDHLAPARHFVKCERPFRHFRLEELTFGEVQKLTKLIGRTAEELIFDNVDLGERQFYAIMKCFVQLRKLTLTRCSQLFMTGSFLENEEEAKAIEGALGGVKYLSLRYNPYVTDAIVHRLAQLIRCLDTLNMADCHIAYHSAIHRRFYPNENAATMPSETILTFSFIMRVLRLHRAHLRELNFSNTMIGSPALMALCDMKTEPGGSLQLLRLRLAYCRQLNMLGVKALLQTQPQLVLLDLSDTVCVSDECIECIVAASPLLEELNCAGCPAIGNRGATLISSLKSLRRLNISRCDGITTEGITQGIARAPNETLRELSMSSLKICEECVKCIAQNCTQLRVLNLAHCVNGVTDESVQCVIEHLRWLRELCLEDCFRVTDTALTGINISQLGLKPASCSALENFHPPPASERLNSSTQSLKISLRSKAEEEIVRDAKRKQAMFAVYELSLCDDSSQQSDTDGFNIQRLRGLQSLNLKGCNRITDVSLKYGLQMLELRRLSVANCQQVSIIGMEALAHNCPSIEELDLSDCYNISDKTIQVLTARLTRLRALHINGCTQLTDHSLDAILVNCKWLQTLSVHRCRHMCADVEDRLAELPTLRNLNMDNMGNMENAEIFRLKKRLDY